MVQKFVLSVVVVSSLTFYYFVSNKNHRKRTTIYDKARKHSRCRELTVQSHADMRHSKMRRRSSGVKIHELPDLLYSLDDLISLSVSELLDLLRDCEVPKSIVDKADLIELVRSIVTATKLFEKILYSDDLSLEVFSYLDTASLLSCCQVSNRWYEITCTDELWQQYFIERISNKFDRQSCDKYMQFPHETAALMSLTSMVHSKFTPLSRPHANFYYSERVHLKQFLGYINLYQHYSGTGVGIFLNRATLCPHHYLQFVVKLKQLLHIDMSSTLAALKRIICVYNRIGEKQFNLLAENFGFLVPASSTSDAAPKVSFSIREFRAVAKQIGVYEISMICRGLGGFGSHT